MGMPRPNGTPWLPTAKERSKSLTGACGEATGPSEKSKHDSAWMTAAVPSCRDGAEADLRNRAHDARQHARERRAVALRVVLELPPPGNRPSTVRSRIRCDASAPVSVTWVLPSSFENDTCGNQTARFKF